MNFEISAVIVNYKTPDLSTMAVWSLHSFYPQISICLVDNEADSESIQLFTKLQKEIPNFTYLPQHKNLHHGPGMDIGICSAQTEWILTFDSDCLVFRAGFLEQMFDCISNENDYMVGQLDRVDQSGKDCENQNQSYAYIHPKCALLKKSIYLKLPPFEIHGAPCLKNQISAAQNGFQLLAFPVRDYVYHIGRGTVDRFGYRLGLRERIKSLIG